MTRPQKTVNVMCLVEITDKEGVYQADPGGPGGPGPPPPTTKNEAPAPKFYKIEAPKWQF